MNVSEKSSEQMVTEANVWAGQIHALLGTTTFRNVEAPIRVITHLLMAAVAHRANLKQGVSVTESQQQLLDLFKEVCEEVDRIALTR